MLPVDTFEIIYGKLHFLDALTPTPFISIGRVCRTCKILHITSSRFILDRLIELHPGVGPKIRVSLFYLLLPKEPPWRKPLSIFEYLISTSYPHLSSLFKYIILGLEDQNEELVDAALSILKLLLQNDLFKELFPDYIDNIVERLVPSLEDDYCGLNNANYCLWSILKKGLIKPDSPCLNNIVRKVTALIKSKGFKYPHFFQKAESKEILLVILLKMFQLKLINEKLPDFYTLLEKISSLQHNNTNHFFLSLSEVDQNLERAILPKYNVPVIKGILHEGHQPMGSIEKSRISSLRNLLKSIIDSELSGSSDCCKFILDNINGFAYLSKTRQEIQYYIYYKDSWLPISWETYRTIYFV